MLTYLEQFAFTAEELAYLLKTGLFSGQFVECLSQLRFSGSVRALPEGTVHFPNEPVLEVTAPLIEGNWSRPPCST